MGIFTGLVKHLGRVVELRGAEGGAVLELQAPPNFLMELRTGDSVAVNGACLTVESVGESSFSFFLSEETLERTNLGFLKSGEVVNLELPLYPSSRFDGHILTGHIDAVSEVVNIEKKGRSYVFSFSIPSEGRKFIAVKGSIAVDGISLTVAGVYNDFFSVAVIPHTFNNTNLMFRKTGDKVNLEYDIISKYIDSILSYGRGGKSDGEIVKVALYW